MLVHDVIAAITILPSFNLKFSPETISSFVFSLFIFFLKDVINDLDDSESKTLSWGRLGPEILGTTLDKSKSKILVKEIFSSAQGLVL